MLNRKVRIDFDAKKTFTFSVVSYLVLSTYSFPQSPVLNLGDLMIAFGILMCVLQNGLTYFSINTGMLPWIGLLLGRLCLGIIFEDVNGAVIINTLHSLWALCVLCIFVPSYFDLELGKKQLRIIMLCASGIVILQYIGMHFGLYLDGRIPYFIANTAYFDNMHQRPFAFFSEPSTFGWQAMIYLITELFGKKINKKTMCYAIITIVAVFMTKSSAGYIFIAMTAGLWVIFELPCYKRNKIQNFIIIFPVLIVLALLVLSSMDGVEYFIQHIFGNNGEIWGNGITQRTDGNSQLWNLMMQGSVKGFIFGQGMVELEAFSGGVARSVAFWGLVGIIIMGFNQMQFFIKTNVQGKALLICHWIYNFLGACLVGVYPLVYMPFVLMNKPQKECSS